MKRAKVNGKLIEAGPGVPDRAVCPHCGAEVTLRRRKTMDGEVWYWRHVRGEGWGCREGARISGVYVISVAEDKS